MDGATSDDVCDDAWFSGTCMTQKKKKKSAIVNCWNAQVKYNLPKTVLNESARVNWSTQLHFIPDKEVGLYACILYSLASLPLKDFQLFLTEGMGYLQWQIVIKYI